MLQYLVTSKVRRRLLSLLWAREARGSVRELAKLSGVAFAGAHAELKAMQRAQLAVSWREGRREVYAANFEYPHADLLRALVTADARPTTPPTSEDRTLKRKLAALGAPLRGVEPLEVEPAQRMATLARGAQLARHDAVVARGLPLCFWRVRESLDVKALAVLASGAENKHALGFFIELTGELGGDRRMIRLAQQLRDRRMTSVRDFFWMSTPRLPGARGFARATKWGFEMNMDLDSFRTLFDKFAS